MTATRAKLLPASACLTLALACHSEQALFTELSPTDAAAMSPCDPSQTSCAPETTCNNSLDCTAGQVCDAPNHACVECLTSQDCAAGKSCAARRCVEPCQSDRQCTPDGLLCSIPLGHCVQCLEARDCLGGQICQSGACIVRACSPGECKCGSGSVVICAPDGASFVPAGALAAQCIGGAPSCGNRDAGGSGGGGAGGAGGSGGTTVIAEGGPPDAAPGSLLFFDDFEDGVADGWANATLPPTGLAGAWSILADGSRVYRQSNNADGSTQIALAGNGAWTNQIVEAKIKVFSFTSTSSSYFAGVCGRVKDVDNWYCAALRSDGRFSMRARLNADTNTLGPQATVVPAVTTNVWYTVKLEIRGTTLNAYLNGVLQATVSDANIVAGGIAVMGAGVVAEFDDVSVTAP